MKASLIIIALTILAILVLPAAAVWAQAIDDTPVVADEPMVGTQPMVDTQPIKRDVPRVIVRDVEVEDEGLSPGSTSRIFLRIMNTSETTPVNSILLTLIIASSSPLLYSDTNQRFVKRILPEETVDVIFTLYTSKVDLTSINSISGIVNMVYNDERTNNDSTNSVTIQMPVRQAAASNEDTNHAGIRWQPPNPMAGNDPVQSRLIQMGYLAGFAACSACALIIVMYKWRKRIHRLNPAEYTASK